MKSLVAFFLFLFTVNYLTAQEGITARQFYKHERFLASDKLEGRFPGTKGNNTAARYIAKQFKRLQLKKWTPGYLQPFPLFIKPQSNSVNSDTVLTQNVVGYIEGSDPVLKNEYIVIGAHYDHLGYGEDNNSRHTGDVAIHNGADDNASGTAALLEISRLLKLDGVKTNNYLFIAFSGEELGLYGSKYYTDHPTIPFTNVNYMINMDMVGRFNDSAKTITIGGIGTSPAWGTLINEKKPAFAIKIDSSGTGPSDHTSFYRKDLPVLFFFTGLHTDYHKPSDDFDKINYNGQLMIVKYINRLIARASKEPKLAFTKTREQQTTTSARFTVSMGIMPDYTYSGAGVKVDGVSAGRAAEKAGIKTGDVVVKLGEFDISSVESYMQTLSKFKKGDATKVKVKRGDKELEFDIAF